MSDFAFLNRHRISLPGYPDTDASWGFCGAFRFLRAGEWVSCIASDAGGWKHVSVSLYKKKWLIPDWPVMCAVKDLFWEPEDLVVQYHPPASEYVNVHPACLHLWQPIGIQMPRPPKCFV